jgi:multiple sugar transport system substrate-binding protein
MRKISQILVVLLAFCMILTSCGSSTSQESPQTQAQTETNAAEGSSGTASAGIELEDAPFDGWVEGLPKIQAPAGFNWRQFEGTTINFISENTTPSTAIAANIELFEKVTGINVVIEQADLNAVIEKVGLDVNARTARYQVAYLDPQQIMAKNKDNFVDLKKFIDDPTLPGVPGGLEDFYESQLICCGYMGDTDKLLALPYDNATIVLAYRADVFENEEYKKAFMDAKGYDWTPNPDMTWEQYYEVAAWISDQAAKGNIKEVKYGCGQQAKQHDSLMCEFSTVLAANGGDYFEAKDLGSIGTANPGKATLNTPEAIKSAEFYKKLNEVAHPSSTSWDWSGLAEAYAAGEIAMMCEWHEFSADMENPSKSKVVGKTKWTITPKGDVRNADIYGGTGIGISAYASEEEQKAAWLFLVWATSPQGQYLCLTSESGGATPTRYSVYNLPDVKLGMEDPTSEEAAKMPNLKSCKAVQLAWAPENVYLRPKIPMWAEADTIIYTELSKMLAGNITPKQAMENANKLLNELTGN